MKKLLVLLLIATLAAFVFTGCDLLPSEGEEGEGEGEGEVEEVTVEIDGAVTVEGKTFVSAGAHDITVTFPAPVEGSVSASIGLCTGDYSKDSGLAELISVPVVLFHNEDRTVWSGSGDFFPGIDIGLEDFLEVSYCCASYVYVTSGECEDVICISVPVIVDFGRPYTQISIKKPTTNPCTCGGCAWVIKSGKLIDCAQTECCGDDCSGLASWSISIYDNNPFKTCCTIPCEQPIFTCNGTACPIDCTTDCLTEYNDSGTTPDGLYYVVLSLVDNVGNEMQYYAKLSQDSACGVTITEFPANVNPYGDYFLCTDFINGGIERDMVDDFVGICEENINGYGTLYVGSLRGNH